ncbi:MAG: glycosyltransferase family 2 protein [Candidatus Bathyarchaeia archaeon]
MARPKVTIGVCVRNCESSIGEAIESIMKQDYPHKFIELIFVDDGSSDKTLSIIRDYASKIDISVKIFSHKWRGIGYSRNVVVKSAEGKYIVWVDGDMVIPPDYLRKLVDFMETHPEVGIAKGKQSIKAGFSLLGTLEAYSRAASRMVNYRSEKAKFKSLGTGGAIYRVEALRHVEGFDETMRGYYEDFDVELRMKAFRWTLDTVDVDFCDYERKGLDYGTIWKRYWFRGYFAHYFLHKNKGAIQVYKMFPLIALVAGLLDAAKLYPLTGRIVVFSLPIIFLFKTCAWNIGFLASHLDNYEPNNCGM